MVVVHGDSLSNKYFLNINVNVNVNDREEEEEGSKELLNLMITANVLSFSQMFSSPAGEGVTL